MVEIGPEECQTALVQKFENKGLCRYTREISLVTLQRTIETKDTGNRRNSRTQSVSMAETYLRCDECCKKLKTFRALVTHYEKSHVNKPVPHRAVFFEDNKEVQLEVGQAIRSPAVQEEYKTWLVGVVERLNGIHHPRHKRESIQVADS